MPPLQSILLISSDTQLTQAVRQALQEDSSKPTLTQTATTADLLTNLNDLQDIGLVLLDNDVRNSSSELEFLMLIRSHSDFQHLPVYVLTDYQLPCDLTEAYQANATSITIKPFSEKDWGTFLRTLLHSEAS